MYEEIIKKIDLANESHKSIGGNFGRTMTITMDEAFLFKRLLEKRIKAKSEYETQKAQRHEKD